MRTKLHTLLVGASCALSPVSAFAQMNFTGGAELVGGGEIVSFDAASGSLLTTVSDGATHRVGIYSLSSGGELSNYRGIDLGTEFGPSGASTFSLSSVAADPLGRGFGVATLIPADRLNTVGKVVFFDIASGSRLVVTADVTWRKGRSVALEPIVQEALSLAPRQCALVCAGSAEVSGGQ